EDQRAEDEELVRERVEERAKDGLLPALAREVAVEEIGDAAEDEDQRREGRERAAVVVDEREHGRQGGEAREREEVGQVGDLVAERPELVLARHQCGSSMSSEPSPAHSTVAGSPPARRGTTPPVQPARAAAVTRRTRSPATSMATSGRPERTATQ